MGCSKIRALYNLGFCMNEIQINEILNINNNEIFKMIPELNASKEKMYLNDLISPGRYNLEFKKNKRL